MQASQEFALVDRTASFASNPANVRRAVTAATIGTIIEWYDYALYGAASGLIINKLFFPQFSAVGGVLAAFATFAVGFFMRPVGGIVISHFGDRFGRKPALIFTIALMGAATVAMGLLPNFNQIGVAAPILLVFFRLLQGFGAGAEYAGAVTLVSEYVAPGRRGFYTAILQAATVVGIMLATIGFLLVSYVPEEALLSWAWRIPFLVSAVLFFVALYIRNQLDETPEYVTAMERAEAQHRENKVPIGELIRNSPKEVLFGFLSVTGHNANAYILSAFALSYMTNTLGMPRTDALVAVIISAFAGIVLTPIMGALADRIGNARVYIFGAVFMVLRISPVRHARHQECRACVARDESRLWAWLRRHGRRPGSVSRESLSHALPVFGHSPRARTQRDTHCGPHTVHRVGSRGNVRRQSGTRRCLPDCLLPFDRRRGLGHSE
jgi:MHS family shikimate/dehydroshikimate transporter-like MFS transporter